MRGKGTDPKKKKNTLKVSPSTAGRLLHKQNGNLRSVRFLLSQREKALLSKEPAQREIHAKQSIPPLTSRYPHHPNAGWREESIYSTCRRRGENTPAPASASPVIVTIPSIVTNTPPDEQSGRWLALPWRLAQAARGLANPVQFCWDRLELSAKPPSRD